MEKIINLTPHAVIVDGVTFPPSGKIARVEEKVEHLKEVALEDGKARIALVKKTYGEVVGLPDPCEGTYYIVSAMVRLACPAQQDLLSPGDLIRDDKGVIVGCKNLIANA